MNIIERIGDIKTKESWLRVIRNQDPCNSHDLALMMAVISGNDDQRNHMARAYPNLIDAYNEFKNNGYK